VRKAKMQCGGEDYEEKGIFSWFYRKWKIERK
jgi:hypothetical protein